MPFCFFSVIVRLRSGLILVWISFPYGVRWSASCQSRRIVRENDEMINVMWCLAGFLSQSC